MKTLEKQALFWDVDLKKIDPQKNAKFIIRRVLSFGGVDDFRWLVEFYGKEKIKEAFMNGRRLDPKSQNFWCLYFDIDKSKCSQKRSA